MNKSTKENLYKWYSLHVNTTDKIKSEEEERDRFMRTFCKETCDTRGEKDAKKLRQCQKKV
jgi:hypothetical protein